MKKEIHFYIFFIVLILATNANAYLDAGTGSYFIQILIAFIAAGLFSLKMFWKKIWTFIKSIGKRSNNNKS
jgi:energy-coupling factor transporter transmembrane protein EcfT